jgi:acetyltransferase
MEYPAHLMRRRTLADGRAVLIRPIRRDDDAALQAFFATLSGDTLHRRFLAWLRQVPGRKVESFADVDYDRQMGFVCEAAEDGKPVLVGDARYVVGPDGRSCEFGIVISDRWHKSGIAGLLMDALIRAAQARRLDTMEGCVLRDNREMLKFVRALGFEAIPDPADATLVQVVRKL